MSIEELEKDVKAEVLERADELKEAYSSDLLFEIADSHIPIYNHELASCLADDPSLAFVEDEGLININNGVYHIIQVAIYERLIQVAHEAYENLEDDELDKIDLVSMAANICDPSSKNLAGFIH